MIKYKLTASHEVSETHEISVDWNGYNFLIIYGRHINGWFIAIPNWRVCTEAACPDDDFYNTEKLSKVIDMPGAAENISFAVKEHWEGLRV